MLDFFAASDTKRKVAPKKRANTKKRRVTTAAVSASSVMASSSSSRLNESDVSSSSSSSDDEGGGPPPPEEARETHLVLVGDLCEAISSPFMRWTLKLVSESSRVTGQVRHRVASIEGMTPVTRGKAPWRITLRRMRDLFADPKFWRYKRGIGSGTESQVGNILRMAGIEDVQRDYALRLPTDVDRLIGSPGKQSRFLGNRFLKHIGRPEDFFTILCNRLGPWHAAALSQHQAKELIEQRGATIEYLLMHRFRAEPPLKEDAYRWLVKRARVADLTRRAQYLASQQIHKMNHTMSTFGNEVFRIECDQIDAELGPLGSGADTVVAAIRQHWENTVVVVDDLAITTHRVYESVERLARHAVRFSKGGRVQLCDTRALPNGPAYLGRLKELAADIGERERVYIMTGSADRSMYIEYVLEELIDGRDTLRKPVVVPLHSNNFQMILDGYRDDAAGQKEPHYKGVHVVVDCANTLSTSEMLRTFDFIDAIGAACLEGSVRRIHLLGDRHCLPDGIGAPFACMIDTHRHL